MFFFFFKQKTAYEMRISDWSSDVCSSDLFRLGVIARDCEIAAADRTALDADFVRRAVFVAEQHLHRTRRARIGEARVEPAGAVAAADLAIGEDVRRELVREGRIVGEIVGVDSVVGAARWSSEERGVGEEGYRTCRC